MVLRQGKSHKRIRNAEYDAFLQGPNTSVNKHLKKNISGAKVKKNLKNSQY